jgi:O-antigen/teichoic acid export membrane protein
MTNEEVTRHIWRNSISNYIFIGMRLVLGLMMFRMLYQALPKEDFGFWSLLWSLFGYGILLDFGFGIAAMKGVAELSVRQDWEGLSRVLSTIFYLYLGIGAAICIGVILGSHHLIDLFEITPSNRERYRHILIYFFCGMGLTFPLGIFPEMLIGLQRICLANIIFSTGILGNFCALLIAINHGHSMTTFVIIGLLSGFLPSLVSAVFALRCLPKVKVLPRYFSWRMVQGTVKFSLFAYITTVSGIILTRTDQFVLSTALAVSAVAIYQAGAKVGEMFGAISQQLPETFSPAAAHMNAKGDKVFLQKLLINGTRFTVMIATPMYFICACYMDGLLRLITGDAVPERETFWVGQVLLLWGYTSAITMSVPKRIFMMCGHERRLMWISLGEAFLNLVISVSMVLHFRNVLCVAIGSLVSTAFFGWFYIWPWAAREANLSGWALTRHVLVPIWLACLPLIVFVLVGRLTPWLDFRTNTFLFIAQCVIAGLLGAVCMWRRALSVQERATVTAKISNLLTRRSLV